MLDHVLPHIIDLVMRNKDTTRLQSGRPASPCHSGCDVSRSAVSEKVASPIAEFSKLCPITSHADLLEVAALRECNLSYDSSPQQICLPIANHLLDRLPAGQLLVENSLRE